MSQRLIATIGMFDGVHIGHRFLIDFLQSEATRRNLIPAAFTFNRHPLSIVRPDAVPPMLSSLQERIDLLHKAGAQYVEVLDFNGQMRSLSARQFIAMLHDRYDVDALIIGFNNRFGHDRIDGIEQYRTIGAEIGIDIIQAPEYHGIASPVSSSIIRKYLCEGNIDQASVSLGRCYTLTGTVVTGKQLGRTIGFPTANISPLDTQKLIPASGAYAVTVTTADGIPRPAMLNIGSRPTIDRPNAPISLEAHIFDYNADLYGTTVTITFHAYLRPERRFPSLDALRSQLDADASTVKQLFNN